jgi:hypothetical protein
VSTDSSDASVVADDWRVFPVELVASEPYLDHHRPGGHPLLGTVMGIELMCRAISELFASDGRIPLRISGIVVLDPIVVHDPTATARVQVLQRHRELGTSFDCILETTDSSVARHFTATVDLGSSRPSVPDLGSQPADCAPHVTGSQIYTTFFHGPAFQAIDRARLEGDVLVANVAPGMVELTTVPRFVHTEPQLIEACLQSAGLLEIATRSRMMIPRHIGSIEFLDGGNATSTPLVSLARRSTVVDGKSGRTASTSILSIWRADVVFE